MRYVTESSLGGVAEPHVGLKELDLANKGHLGKGVYAELNLKEGQAITFILRAPPSHDYPDEATPNPNRAKELGVSYESKIATFKVSYKILTITIRASSWRF